SVAPFDLPFVSYDEMEQLFMSQGAKRITFEEFEQEWECCTSEGYADLAREVLPGSTAKARYFLAPFPADIPERRDCTWYAEFAAGIDRRQVEVGPTQVFVAPSDIGLADQFETVLEDDLYVEISLGEFNSIWQQFAAPRLREIAGLNSL